MHRGTSHSLTAMTTHTDQSATLPGSGTTASQESRCINYNTGKLFFNESHCETFCIELFLSFLFCPEGGGWGGRAFKEPFILHRAPCFQNLCFKVALWSLPNEAVS